LTVNLWSFYSWRFIHLVFLFFFGVAHKKFGQFVCQFLKKYTTTLTFNLLGNSNPATTKKSKK
jgi:hypothetical protein